MARMGMARHGEMVSGTFAERAWIRGLLLGVRVAHPVLKMAGKEHLLAMVDKPKPGMAETLERMQQKPGNAKVQADGLKDLIGRASGDALPGGKKALFDAALAALQNHPMDARVQASGLAYIDDLVGSGGGFTAEPQGFEPDFQREALEAGVAALATAAMEAHPGQPSVQVNAMTLISGLVSTSGVSTVEAVLTGERRGADMRHHTERETAVQALLVTDVVTPIMAASRASDVTVQLAAVRAVTQLTYRSVLMKERFARAACGGRLVALLASFRGQSEKEEVVAGALATLCSMNEESRRDAVSGGAIDCLVSAMGNGLQDVRLQAAACMALEVLMRGDPETAARALGAGAVESAVAAQTEHENNKWVVGRASGVLSALVQECDEARPRLEAALGREPGAAGILEKR